MLGILLIDKPIEFTSHDVINILRRKFSTKRVGHAGTLDPLATGLLVVAIGPATRFLQYLPLEPKVYIATIEFGRATNTYDREGEVTFTSELPSDYEKFVKEKLPLFRGLIEQIPPMYSAVKKDGKPLYKLARQGIEIERASRKVFIKEFEILSVEGEYATARIVCSGGTYVRSLAHDLGVVTGFGAHLSGLRRVGVGKFLLENAKPLQELEPSDLVSLKSALEPLPMMQLSLATALKACEGQPVSAPDEFLTSASARAEKVGLLGPDGQILGIANYELGLYHPECVLPKEVIGAL